MSLALEMYFFQEVNMNNTAYYLQSENYFPSRFVQKCEQKSGCRYSYNFLLSLFFITLIVPMMTWKH